MFSSCWWVETNEAQCKTVTLFVLKESYPYLQNTGHTCIEFLDAKVEKEQIKEEEEKKYECPTLDMMCHDDIGFLP